MRAGAALAWCKQRAHDGPEQNDELQRTMVNIQVANQTLDKVFEQVEAATRFRFVYNPSEITGSGKVTVTKKEYFR